MDASVVAAIIAGVVAVIVATIPLIKPGGDAAWYRRWVDVRENAPDPVTRELADRQIRHYAMLFVLTDRSRKSRRLATTLGVVLIGAAIVVFFFNASSWVTWACSLILYIGGLVAVGYWPDHVRDRETAKLTNEVDEITAEYMSAVAAEEEPSNPQVGPEGD